LSKNLQAVRGMNDILPDEAERWEALEARLRRWLAAYAYRPLRMPIVEPTPLFARAIGEVTDIVEKEMYSFIDTLSGEPLTLRPEGTAGCVRAVLQHNLLYDGPRRLWYLGPMFRHERPQKGRYRQFHQLGVEALGYTGPDIDAEQMVMIARLWRELGLAGTMRLELNCLGQPEERARHRSALIAHFEQHRDSLDEEAKRRLPSNPLRILDTKNPAMQPIVETAPRLYDYLGEASRAHFSGVCALLDAAKIPWRFNPRLVRGLDYYNLTVFEWVTEQLGAQGTVCAGGRYDGLIAQLGGKPQPACGFAIGLERLLALTEGRDGERQSIAQVYVLHQGEVAQRLAFVAAESLRDAGLAVQLHCGGGSFKAQMRRADQSGARVAVIVGEDEAAAGEASVKPLRAEGSQCRVGIAALVPAVQVWLD